MSTVTRRLAGAALALALLAPAAGAAPGGAQPWWQELWEVLSSFRPGAFWSLGGADKAGPMYDPYGQPANAPVGPMADPLGKPGADKAGPVYDPYGQPAPQGGSSSPNGDP